MSLQSAVLLLIPVPALEGVLIFSLLFFRLNTYGAAAFVIPTITTTIAFLIDVVAIITRFFFTA